MTPTPPIPTSNRRVRIPRAYGDLFRFKGHKVYYGGRGGGKTQQFALAAVTLAYNKKARILCLRQFQSSIKDSVHAEIVWAIHKLRLELFFHVTDKSIRCTRTGSEFMFKGVKRNWLEVKGTAGIDVLWCCEAQDFEKKVWQILLPTIRKHGSEVWVEFNPDQANDATVVQWLRNTPPDTVIHKVGYQDNPFFGKELENQRLHMLRTDPDAYDWVWEGNFRKISNAVIFRKNVRFEAFEAPEGTRFFYGADWGFANDPSAIIRCWVSPTDLDGNLGDCLMIDYEAYGFGVEIDQLPQLFDSIPGVRHWPIKGDNSQPMTIAYMARKNFQITGADKWPGSVEDGIQHLKGFNVIYIHPRCPNISQEARLYSYKVDPKQLDEKGNPVILPIVLDRHNHGWDAVRYSLDGYIQRGDDYAVWNAMAEN